MEIKIFSFGLNDPSTETSAEVLGGKGAGLVWMDQQGISVPPGFIIPTDVCMAYMQSPKTTMKQVRKAIQPWLAKMQLKFGYMPLVSVRSGARQSMPGMMDTILNVGLEADNAQEWVGRLGETCVADSRKRLIEMYGSVVKEIDRKGFEGKSAEEAHIHYFNSTGELFPDASEQMLNSIEAVFKSWNNERAKIYRKLHNIPETWGTAVTVQAMVFGNLNDKSATGVLFTRNPDSGELLVTGEFLVNAQGEDVVAGTATPKKLEEMGPWNPAMYDEVIKTAQLLEVLKKDVQDVEFTIQDGKLFILQTRNAKRSSRAAIRIAVEMAQTGMLTKAEAFKRISLKDYMRAQSPVIDPAWVKKNPAPYAGIPACSGVVTGKVVHSSEEAVNKAKEGVILVTQETTPDDIAGMVAAKGVLTMTGGATSHAAVVARGMNKPCIVGLGIDLNHFQAGMQITIDGASGHVWSGSVPVSSGAADKWLATLNQWMVEETKVRIIDQKDGDLLDVSELLDRPMEAAELVKQVLKTRPSVFVDTRPAGGKAFTAFNDLFPTAHSEDEVVEAIQLKVGSQKEYVKFLTGAKNVSRQDKVAIVKTPEDLVMAEGSFIVEVEGKWVQKLLSFKKEIEGTSALLLGQVVEGGFVSLAQLAQALLK